jgi:TatD DNase family protein
MDMTGLPTGAPPKPKSKLRYADVRPSSTRLDDTVLRARQVAVTATAKEFQGIYRGKQYHEPDFSHTLDRAASAGVEKIVLTGMSVSDMPTNLAIAESRPPGSCFVTMGVHPYHAAEPAAEGPAYLERLRASVNDALRATPRLLAAFGELGLDYDRLQHADRATQLATFRAQLDLHAAEGWDLPLFLHLRGTADSGVFDDFVAVLGGRRVLRGLVHSFVGTRAQMERLVARVEDGGLGLDVSVNTFSFADRDSLDMVAAVPLDRLQIETDAPWGEVRAASEVAKRYLVNAPPLPQAKKRGKWDASCMVKERNESCAIERVAYVVAGLKGISVEEVAEAAWRNSVNMFGLGDSEVSTGQ